MGRLMGYKQWGQAIARFYLLERRAEFWRRQLPMIAAGLLGSCLSGLAASGAIAAPPETSAPPDSADPPSMLTAPAGPSPNRQDAADTLNLDPAILDGSPVLQRWQQQVPDVRSRIRHDPAFRTRVRLGYTRFAATDPRSGLAIGVEDVFLGESGVTLSGELQRTTEGDRTNAGAELRYYLLPLGNYVNVAPVVGYRSLETDRYQTDGLAVGLRVMLALSRTGAADIALSQSWVSPGTEVEVGLTTLSVGYAIAPNVRISTDLQQQNAVGERDSRYSLFVEWMP